MNIEVNGEPREISEDATILALLESLGLHSNRVAVEVNAQVVRRARHGEQRLSAGDKVEIVTFVGGG